MAKLWGYLLQHLDDGRYIWTASRFRRAVIEAERDATGDRIPLLVDIVLAALDYAGNDSELDAALVAAGYLPKEVGDG